MVKLKQEEPKPRAIPRNNPSQHRATPNRDIYPGIGFLSSLFYENTLLKVYRRFRVETGSNISDRKLDLGIVSLDLDHIGT